MNLRSAQAPAAFAHGSMGERARRGDALSADMKPQIMDRSNRYIGTAAIAVAVRTIPAIPIIIPRT